jgi:Glycosyltransferase family 87
MTKASSRNSGVPCTWPFLLVWIVYSLLVLLGVKFLLFPSGLTERMDFRQLYAAGYQARTDPANLYDYEHQKAVQDALVSKAEGLLPFIRPAYEVLVFVPLSYLPYRSAYLCFLGFNLLLLLACFFACQEDFSHPGTFAQPRSGLQMFLFYPVIVAILQGQDSILLLLGFCLAYRSLKSGRLALAGVLLGLMMFKFQITIPLATFLLFRYASVSFFAGLAGGSALVYALSILTVGWNAFVSFGRVLLLTNSASLAQGAPNGVLGVVPRAMPNLKGLISAMAMGRVSGTVVVMVTLVLSAAIAIRLIQKLRFRRPSLESSFSLAATGALLLSYYIHLQDLTVLLLPLGLMADVKNLNLTRANWLLYLAPPLLVILGHSLLSLLSLSLMIFLYGIAQATNSDVKAIASAMVSR